MNNDKGKISVADDYEITRPRKRRGFVVDQSQWDWLKKLINELDESTNWLEISIGASIAAVLAFGIAAITCEPLRWYFIIASLASVIISSLVGYFLSSIRARAKNNKRHVIEYMNMIEVKEDISDGRAEETPGSIKLMGDWVASRKPNVTFGIDYIEIPLNGKQLRYINFAAQSSSPFWRAAIKFGSPPVEDMKNNLIDGNFLLHVGKDTSGKNDLKIYAFGQEVPNINKHITDVVNGTIHVEIEIHKDGFVSCYVNRKLEYKGQVSINMLKKAYLLAFSHKQDYTTKFYEIKYDTYDD